ncbi:hypothetical protein [Granulicella sp. L60]|uniref:hypothetical protein n=1 Tax=Granulicella sp. L60 TaxID=1641866 RepID=UPI00131C2FB4|nr:hypothetical protein [Granulicella sp. L60]
MNRSVFTKSLRAQIFCGLLIACATAALTSCHSDDFLAYKFPTNPFANRPVPPSLLANRVMVGVTVNGTSSGSLQILDALRDLRNNIENTKPSFSISGYSSAYPNLILNFPAEITGYVYSAALGDIQIINYGKETVSGAATKFPALSTSLAIPPTFAHLYSAEESTGQLVIADNTTGGVYPLNLPNVYSVSVNPGDTVVLAMVRNSNTVYRVVKLNLNTGSTSGTSYPTSTAAIAAIGAVDCQPFNNPVYCVVPVNPGTAANAFDRPQGAYFSLDGNYAYVLNCGAECGGKTSSVTFLQQGVLEYNKIPTSVPDASAFVVQVPVAGGVTDALSDGTTLYVSGQQQQTDGLFAGNLSTINLATALTSPSTAVTAQVSISDGTHTKMLFGDDNTLWIGSQLCATGERAKLAAQEVAAGQNTDQAANYNCLTRVTLPSGSAGLSVSIVPAVTQSTSAPVVVPFPNTNQNQYYYGDLTGLCWVEGLHKVYTAYGGQVHAFNTADGSEINNKNITVQGTALDVAYLDAITDAAD